MVEISKVLGTDDLFKYIQKYKITINSKEHTNLKYAKRKGLESFINEENAHLCGEDAMDLINKMLTYDHLMRPTAKEAMAHKYFDPVRAKGDTGG